MTPTTRITLSRTNERGQDSYITKSMLGTHYNAFDLLEAFSETLKGDGFPESTVKEAIDELHESYGTQDESEPTQEAAKPYWRLLNDNEVIEEGDESYDCVKGAWRRIIYAFGRQKDNYPPVRRLVQ